ncbi:MAG: tyrosine-protein phosphatase [Candidatus Limnocylindrales bacterium]
MGSTTSAPRLRSPFPSLVNLRDVAGHPTCDGGRVRTGLLSRSAGLNTFDAGSMPAFERPSIRTLYDLRSRSEREAQPERVPPGRDTPSGRSALRQGGAAGLVSWDTCRPTLSAVSKPWTLRLP